MPVHGLFPQVEQRFWNKSGFPKESKMYFRTCSEVFFLWWGRSCVGEDRMAVVKPGCSWDGNHDCAEETSPGLGLC